MPSTPTIVFLLSDGLGFLFLVLALTQYIIPALFGMPTFWLFSREKREIIDEAILSMIRGQKKQKPTTNKKEK